MIPAKAHVYETTPQIKNRILPALSKLEYERLLHIAAGECLTECSLSEQCILTNQGIS
jgi:hypothetical protein